MRLDLNFLLLGILLAGIGFYAVSSREEPRPPDCAQVVFEDAPFTVCAYDPARHTLQLALRDGSGAPLGDFDALSAHLGEARVAFAMNAGMYGPDQRPIGLYVEDGEELRRLNRADGPGNFHLKPNGVFWIDEAGEGHVKSSDDYAAAAPSPRFATQSGPLLLDEGAWHPEISEDGPSRNIRNGVAVCRDGVRFAISDAPVSFGKFARLFRDELGCADALYLDGAVSALWAPRLGRKDTQFGLGPFVVALER